MSPPRLASVCLLVALAWACKSESAQPAPDASAELDTPTSATSDPEASKPQRSGEAEPSTEAKPEPEPEPAPPSFAEQIAPLVGAGTPTADSGTTAWTHYKAKSYREAQTHFALAALHDTGSWKPAFNLACASALAEDEPMVRVALTEAIARDAETVREKARTDGDLAPYRATPWFEDVLAGQPEVGADAADADADTEDEDAELGMMYFVLGWGPDGPGGVAYLDDTESFALHSREGRRIEVAPDGLDYLLRVNGDPSIAVNYGSAERVMTDKRLGSVWHFDARSGGELWAAGSEGVGHYTRESGGWKVFPTPGGVAKPSFPVGIEVGDDGKTLVAYEAAVFALVDDRFQPVALPSPAGKHVELLRGADGLIYLHRATDVVRLTGSASELATGPKPPAGGSLERVTVLADGSIVAFTRPDHRLVRATKAGATQRIDLDGVTSVDALGVDTGSRVWVATPVGIFVIAPDFSGITRRYGVGSIDAFAPSDGHEQIIQFVSLGPAMSLPPSEAPRGVVVGRLLHAGEPLADKHFEMCMDPARTDRELGSMGTPCEFDDDIHGGKTDADGRFRLTGVGDGLYDFAAFVPGGKIGATKNSPCCADMPDAGIYDLGDITLR